MIISTAPLRSITLILAITLFAIGVTDNAIAGPLTIVDCNGKKRAEKSVNASSNGEVKVEVVNSAGVKGQNVQMFLTNEEGIQLSTTSIDGVATFPEVPSGTWVLSSPQPDFFLSTITLGEFIPPIPLFSSIGTVGKAALVVGAVTAGAVIVDQIADNSSSGGGRGGSSSGTGGSCLTCNPDAEAPSIPSFGE